MLEGDPSLLPAVPGGCCLLRGAGRGWGLWRAAGRGCCSREGCRVPGPCCTERPGGALERTSSGIPARTAELWSYWQPSPARLDPDNSRHSEQQDEQPDPPASRLPVSTTPAPAAIPAPCPTARRSPRSPHGTARTLAPLLQSPLHSGAHAWPPVPVTPPPRWGSDPAARGARSRAASQARACSHRPVWVLGEPRTRVCARTSSLMQPSLIGSQEHNFSSNYIFSTSEKMRFW